MTFLRRTDSLQSFSPDPYNTKPISLSVSGSGGTSVSSALECPHEETRSIVSLDTSQMVSVYSNTCRRDIPTLIQHLCVCVFMVHILNVHAYRALSVLSTALFCSPSPLSFVSLSCSPLRIFHLLL